MYHVQVLTWKLPRRWASAKNCHHDLLLICYQFIFNIIFHSKNVLKRLGIKLRNYSYTQLTIPAAVCSLTKLNGVKMLCMLTHS